MAFRSSISRAVLAAVLALGAVVFVAAQSDADFSLDNSPLPKPTEPVNDFAGVLSPQTVSELNQKIKDFKAHTNPPVVLAVAVVRTTGDRDIFSYSLAVARGWKIGTDKDDNPSALLLIAIDDRKYFTQVSRDLEDEMPDGLVGQLQRKYLVPAFKQRDYDKGVRDTVQAYMDTIEGKVGVTDAPAPTTGQRTKKSGGLLSNICGLLVMLFIFFSLFAGRRRRGGFFVIGGGGGGGGSWGGSGGGDWGGFSGGDFGGGGAGGDW